ncbi:MAG: RagB/SusD family nutrient uptake outer membrane protein [Ekhidna sp.]
MIISSKKLYLPLIALLFSACSLEDLPDPNGPSLSGTLSNANQQTMNFLVTGLEAEIRNGRAGFITATGTIARELYDFNSSDPATLVNLLGKEGTQLTGSEPQLTGTIFARYQAVKSADFILQAVEDATVTEAQKRGYRAFAYTMRGYALIDVLMLLDDNGVRVDISDPDNLGPWLDRSAGFAAIRQMLDDGFDQLTGAEFSFALSSGFDGFDSPASFGELNRAIAARAALYDGDHAAALTLLGDSFLSLNAADLTTGARRFYAQTEILNPIFKTPQQSTDQYVVHNRLVTDIRPTDTRISKFRVRDVASPRDGVNGTHEMAIYATSTDPIDHIRNEELILIYAEANINATTPDFQAAEDALNILNGAYGLANYAGAQNVAELTDELIYHRTYSLWGEGHAMFDLRRNGRLNSTNLPLDRAGDLVHTHFPIPPFDR